MTETKYPAVVEWDEYLQGYNRNGLLVRCICGEYRPGADWGDHFCPYDEQPEDEE